LCANIWLRLERSCDSFFPSRGSRSRLNGSRSHRTRSRNRLRSGRGLRLGLGNRSWGRLLFFDSHLHLFFLRRFCVKPKLFTLVGTGRFGSLSLKLLFFFVFHFM
jgi:hypothetical protein